MMIEGGGQLAAAFIRANLVDRIEWFRAPILLGGDGRPCLGNLGLASLADAPAFQRTSVRELGLDLWESYARR
jgi:diaminohydroxyphosphoribosylaminopyrimidine deaminase/5-amino-6-(5-phosphoribosylamino)uracil reductase